MKTLTRPRGLIVIILVQILVGLLSLIGGIIPSVFSLTSQAQSLGFLQFLAPILPIVLIVLGVFYLSLSYGFMEGIWLGLGYGDCVYPCPYCGRYWLCRFTEFRDRQVHRFSCHASHPVVFTAARSAGLLWEKKLAGKQFFSCVSMGVFSHVRLFLPPQQRFAIQKFFRCSSVLLVSILLGK